MQTPPSQPTIRTNIPFRLDRLPWSRFHLLVVVGLGITWILDGLEVTIVGSLGPALQSTETLHLSSANLGAVASFYVVGAVVGALVFGWITDRHGRRLVVLKGIQRKSWNAGHRNDLNVAASIIANDAAKAGVRSLDVLIGIIAPLLYRIGEDWKRGTLSVEGASIYGFL
jgi:MFS family permease